MTFHKLMQNVQLKKDGKNIKYMMDFCLELTSCVFQVALLDSCCYRKHMLVVWWVTLDGERHMRCWLTISIGQRWEETFKDLCKDTSLVTKLSQNWTPMDYILPCLFLVLLGKTLAWILFWVYQGQRGGGQFLLLLIDSLKWHISYHVIKAMMLPT